MAASSSSAPCPTSSGRGRGSTSCRMASTARSPWQSSPRRTATNDRPRARNETRFPPPQSLAKLREMAALDAETALITILEGIGQPFYAVDGGWRITHFNGEAARHFGRPAAEMIGRRFWDIYPEDLHSERARSLFEAMEQRRT